MLIKGIAVVAALSAAAAGGTIADQLQDPLPTDDAGAASDATSTTDTNDKDTVIATLRARVTELESELNDCNRQRTTAAELTSELTGLETRIEQATATIAERDAELADAWGLVAEHDRRHRNCAPSRSLMVRWDWTQRRGNEAGGKEVLDSIVKRVGDRASSINSLTWSLMTDKRYRGKHDELANALSDRMLAKGKNHLRHQHLDTAALAKFLNGEIATAIDLQKSAIKSGGDSTDYRRRLRTYEAASKELAKAGATTKAKARPSVNDE